MARARAALGLAALLLSVAACGGGSETTATSVADVPSTATASPASDAPVVAETASASESGPGRQDLLVDIGGRDLHVICSGAGTPTVVLDHGLEGSSGNWLAVLDGAAQAADTRVCAYDRAGRGQSDRVRGTRTGQDLADDLHALIAAADLGPPVVLVGHSIAGLHLRLLATQHPEDAAAMVLVDVAHPDQFQRIAEVLPPESPDDGPLLGALRDITKRGDPTGAPNRERLEVGTTNKQVRATGSLGALPLAVLSGSDFAEGETEGKIAPDVVATLQALHETMGAELATLSTNSAHVVVPGAGHFIQDDQPQAVVDAIAAAVETARHGGHIADRLPPGEERR